MGSLNDALLKSGQERRAREAAKKAAQPQSPPTQKRGFLQTERAASMQQYEAEQRASNAARARGAAMPLSPTKSGPVIGGRGGGGAIGRMPLSPTKSGPVAGGRGGGGAAGRMTTQKAAPAVAPRKPTPKPMSAMDKVRADKGLMDTIRSDAAALRKPAQKAAPKAAASKKSSGLSANKSYADYKKLMESM